MTVFTLAQDYPNMPGEGVWFGTDLAVVCPNHGMCSCGQTPQRIVTSEDEPMHRFVGGTRRMPTIRSLPGLVGSIPLACGWHGYLTDGEWHTDVRGYKDFHGVYVPPPA